MSPGYWKKRGIFLAASLLVFFIYSASAFACGGVTATIADDPNPFGVRTVRTRNGVTLHLDQAGNVYVDAKEIKISSALADAIAKRYLEQQFSQYEHLEFEGFTYDHGDLVYMYHAHVPDLAYSVHVGPVQFATDHAHIHVSAVTGDVYGPGCGMGSGIVEMPFDPQAYPAELQEKHLPYLQFDTEFIAREGQPPTIDGRIEPGEWEGAGYQVLHVGTVAETITAYGWGGSGQAVASQPERFTIELYTKIHQGLISFAVRADTTHWVALLLKDFPHHGMIGDFNDAKLLTTEGIEDFFLAAFLGQQAPSPRKLAGVHTWMAAGALVRDQESNITAAGVQKNDGVMVYEFAFPYQNDDLGDTLWEVGKAYQLAVLVGSSEEFSDVTPETWMSDQIHIRLGTSSKESIYDPPYFAAQAQEDHHHQKGGRDEQK